MSRSLIQVIVTDSARKEHLAETLTQAEYDDEGIAGCETIARNYCEDHGLQYRNWRRQEAMPLAA